MSNTPKYPNVHVELIGQDGNAFAILGRVTQAMRRSGVSEEEQKAFSDEATSGDYDHLLRTVTKWVSVGADEEDDEEEDEYWDEDDGWDDEDDEDEL